MSEQKPSASIAGLTLPNTVIVYKHKHGTELIPATGDNLLTMVKRMVAQSTRMRKIAELVGPEVSPKLTVRGHLWFWAAIYDIVKHDINSPEARPSKTLGRMFTGKLDNPVAIQPEWISEVLAWLVTQTVTGKRGSVAPLALVTSFAKSREASSNELALAADGYKTLSFLEPARNRLGEITFVSSAALDDYDEYQILVSDKWKPEIMSEKLGPERIAIRYIRFLNELSGDDFDLTHLVDDVSDIEFSLY